MKIKIKKDILNNPIILAYFILIFVAIFNSNKYHAAIVFIFPAVGLASGLCFLNMRFDVKKTKGYIPIVFICISAILSTIFSDVVEWNMIGTSFIIFAVLYMILTIRNFSGNEIKTILKFYAYITLILAILLIFNLLLSNNILDGRVSITLLNVRKDENYLSAYMVFGFFYFTASFLWGSHKKKYLFFAICIFIAVFMTGSRGGLIAMLISAFVMMAKYVFLEKITVKTIFMVIGFSVGIIAVYILLSGTPLFSRMSNAGGYTDNIRLVIWRFAMEAFLRRPWLGSGIQSGTFFAQRHVRWFTHSCFVDLITSVGLIGAVLYIWQYMQYCRVKRGNFVFLFSMMIILFAPLMFINGFETLTFWLPMSLCKLVSDYCRKRDYPKLLA